MQSQKGILESLSRSDETRLAGRAERIEWLALHDATRQGVVQGIEAQQLRREARATFVDGHYLAVLLLAIAFIEHTVLEELQFLDHIKARLKFEVCLAKAAEHKVFPQDWIDRAENLRLLRNAVVHPKSEEDANALGNRYRKQGVAPTALLELDAKDAIDLMNNFFVATLRQMS